MSSLDPSIAERVSHDNYEIKSIDCDTNQTIEIKSYSRESAISQLSLINRWCLKHYRNYPYLYAADEEPIISPSDLMYVNDPNALVVTARENSNVIV